MDSERAFYDEVIAPMRRRMVCAVWRVVRNPDATDDVIQDVLVYLLRRREKILRHPNPTALILRACHHRALDHVRKRNRRQAALDAFREEEGLRRRGDPRPDRALQLGELKQQLLAALGKLPPRQAEAVLLHVIEDLPYSDVAQAMGCRVSTVRVLVHTARNTLRTLIRDVAAPIPREEVAS